jgi:cellulose synthase/poly-beta-1,6-N-acetylglucosamine synthase-like glycosyltransferase
MINPMLSWLLLLFPGIYALQVLKWIFSLGRKTTFQKKFTGEITWIVPFKNEENNLEAFFQSILKQTHFPEELILVNDHSSDDSVKIIEKWSAKMPFPMVLVDHVGEGKKRAISQAIEMAKGEVMVCSDADCEFSPHFFASISQPFVNDEVVWVSGRVSFESDGSFWKEVLAAENEGLQAITAASIRGNQPTMANGAAMAFRKRSFVEVGGYWGLEHLVSGDDELLLHRMQGKGKLVYAENAVVRTQSANSWNAFWKQRIRWVSKSADYENRRMQWTMLVAWMSRVSWLFSLVGIGFFGMKFLILNTALLLIPEAVLLQGWGLSFRRAVIHGIIQPAYAIYVVIIPILSRIYVKK